MFASPFFRNSNIVDNMIRMMENYTDQLEHLVDKKTPHFHKIGCALGTWHLALSTWHLALCPWPHFEIEGFWNSEVAYFKMFLDEI